MVIEFLERVSVDGRVEGTIREHWVVKVSPESEDASAGTGAARWVFRFAGTLIAVKGTCTTAPTGSSALIDLNVGGSSVMTNRVEIEATETDSDTATTQPSIATAAFAGDSVFTADLDQVGSSTPGQGFELEIELERTS